MFQVHYELFQKIAEGYKVNMDEQTISTDRSLKLNTSLKAARKHHDSR